MRPQRMKEFFEREMGAYREAVARGEVAGEGGAAAGGSAELEPGVAYLPMARVRRVAKASQGADPARVRRLQLLSLHHLQLQLLAGPNAIIRALTNADIAFGFLGIVSLDYTKVMGAFLSVAIAAAFILGPAVVGYV